MNKWISVKDRLPEEEVPVLVTYLSYNTGEPIADSIAIFSEGEWYWYTDPDNDYIEQGPVIVEITHWVPLPEPAKEETEVVELCPHCEKENVYTGWNTETDGFVAVCSNCGNQIFLCSECLNESKHGHCNWIKTECGSSCYRGETVDKENSDA